MTIQTSQLDSAVGQTNGDVRTTTSQVDHALDMDSHVRDGRRSVRVAGARHRGHVPNHLHDPAQLPKETFADRFVIDGEAAVGGMSIVYRAFDELREEVVALKILQKVNAATLRRFEAEAHALERIEHPAVVRYIAHGMDAEGEPYLAMEWVEGETLWSRLQRGPLEILEAVRLGLRLAGALELAHALGIVHGDISPGNLLLPEKDLSRAKLSDFGLARTTGIGHADLAGHGTHAVRTVLGTPGYMAPEHADDTRDIDGRADLFSLGCLLFRSLTGVEAFEAAPGLSAWAKSLLLEPPRTSIWRPDVPPAFEKLIARLLAKDPQDRPPQAVFVRDALHLIKNDLERLEDDALAKQPMAPSAPHTLESPADITFGRYVVEGRLPSTGKVLCAYDSKLHRRVVLKIFSEVRGPAAVARLIREARTVAGLHHPHIAAIHDVGEHAGIPFLVREYVCGDALRSHMGAPSVPMGQRILWMQAVARGLAAAHRGGIIHGDLNPDNVFVGDEPGASGKTIKLLDVGLASAAGTAFDASPYMSPEQVRGEAIDGRSDQFAWGVMACEVLTGRIPSITEDSLRAPANASDVPADGEWLPANVANVIRRAIREQRDERFPNMDALLAELVSGAPQPPSSHVGSVHRARHWLWAALLAVGVALVFLVHPPALHLPSSKAPASASEKGIAITDLPVSPKCSSAALGLHRQGMQALRGADGGRAFGLFQKAADADPSCPEAQLRLTLSGLLHLSDVQQREQLRKTLALRDQLGDRDRLVLDAFASMFGAISNDESKRLLDEALRRFPTDAEIPVLVAVRNVYLGTPDADQLEGLLELQNKATTLDPEYADAWQTRAAILALLGRPKDELEALNHCLKIAPGAADCMQQRVGTLRSLGRCEEAVADVRRWLTWSPDQSSAYRQLAACLASHADASRESIEEALLLAWNRLAPSRQEAERLCDLAKLAIWEGDFNDALRRAAELERYAAGSALLESHACATKVAIEALLETGDDARAATVAKRFLDRNPAWTNAETPFWTDSLTPSLLALLLEQGQLTRDGWRRRNEAWERSNQSKLPSLERWIYRWGPVSGQSASAHEALGSAPRASTSLDLAPLAPIREFMIGTREAYEGRIYLNAGDVNRALPLLERAAASCQGIDQAALHVQAQLWLGFAREGLGDRSGACDAYDAVVRRWGKSNPSSVTAKEADRHRHALRCAA